MCNSCATELAQNLLSVIAGILRETTTDRDAASSPLLEYQQDLASPRYKALLSLLIQAVELPVVRANDQLVQVHTCILLGY